MSNGLIIGGGGSRELRIGGRGITVIDNLNSDSATDALSAKQGKVLNEAKQEKIVAGANITIGADEKTISADLSSKQDVLVSGTNIKTINNESIVGSGNITITGTGEMNVLEGVQINGTDLVIDANKKVNIPIASTDQLGIDTKGVVGFNYLYGVKVEGGIAMISKATDSQIDGRLDNASKDYAPIVTGNLDYAVRSVRPSTATVNPSSSSRMAVNTIYTFGDIGSEATFYLPSSGQIGDFVEINFATGSTTPTITFDATPTGMYISDYDAATEANKAYTYFADWGMLDYNEALVNPNVYGWRISRAEYELPPSNA